jgi:hypothetical protein
MSACSANSNWLSQSHDARKPGALNGGPVMVLCWLFLGERIMMGRERGMVSAPEFFKGTGIWQNIYLLRVGWFPRSARG